MFPSRGTLVHLAGNEGAWQTKPAEVFKLDVSLNRASDLSPMDRAGGRRSLKASFVVSTDSDR